MNYYKIMWWIVLVVSFIWLILNLLSIMNYTLINTFEVVHAERYFGETTEILEREKEVVGLIKLFIMMAISNILILIAAIISIRKNRK